VPKRARPLAVGDYHRGQRIGLPEPYRKGPPQQRSHPQMRAWLPFGVLFTTPVTCSVLNSRLPPVESSGFPSSAIADRCSVFFRGRRCKPCCTQPINRGQDVAIGSYSYFSTIPALAFLKSWGFACATFILPTVVSGPPKCTTDGHFGRVQSAPLFGGEEPVLSLR